MWLNNIKYGNILKEVIMLPERVKCERCQGNGKVLDGSVPGGVKTCPQCQGDGGWWK